MTFFLNPHKHLLKRTNLSFQIRLVNLIKKNNANGSAFVWKQNYQFNSRTWPASPTFMYPKFRLDKCDITTIVCPVFFMYRDPSKHCFASIGMPSLSSIKSSVENQFWICQIGRWFACVTTNEGMVSSSRTIVQAHYVGLKCFTSSESFMESY